MGLGLHVRVTTQFLWYTPENDHMVIAGKSSVLIGDTIDSNGWNVPASHASFPGRVLSFVHPKNPIFSSKMASFWEPRGSQTPAIQVQTLPRLLRAGDHGYNCLFFSPQGRPDKVWSQSQTKTAGGPGSPEIWGGCWVKRERWCRNYTGWKLSHGYFKYISV